MSRFVIIAGSEPGESEIIMARSSGVTIVVEDILTGSVRAACSPFTWVRARGLVCFGATGSDLQSAQDAMMPCSRKYSVHAPLFQYEPKEKHVHPPPTMSDVSLTVRCVLWPTRNGRGQPGDNFGVTQITRKSISFSESPKAEKLPNMDIISYILGMQPSLAMPPMRSSSFRIKL